MKAITKACSSRFRLLKGDSAKLPCMTKLQVGQAILEMVRGRLQSGQLALAISIKTSRTLIIYIDNLIKSSTKPIYFTLRPKRFPDSLPPVKAGGISSRISD